MMNALRLLLPFLFHARRKWPDWADQLCRETLAEAKRTIQMAGVKLRDEDLAVVIREGRSWYEERLGMWIGGLTEPSGRRITICATEIGNPSSVHRPSLVHEMGHHWLLTNNKGGGHDAKFDKLPGWAQARLIMGR